MTQHVSFSKKRRAVTVTIPRGVHRDIVVSIVPAMHGDYSLSVVLAGIGASADIRGGGMLTHEQTVSLTVDTIHRSSHTSASTVVRTVLADRAQFDFSGTIKITKRAQQSRDFLEQRSLLLSDDARATSVPALEIEADDVKASHAASVAPVDPEQLFYLRSRGMTEQAARTLLAEAFLSPIAVRP